LKAGELFSGYSGRSCLPGKHSPPGLVVLPFTQAFRGWILRYDHETLVRG
jgi:hypothetical protein